MRFLRQSMIGLFLAAATLGFLVLAADLIGGAVQQRLTDTPPERAPRELDQHRGSPCKDPWDSS